ncbi:hypothetical protein FF1_041866 [Malus domestica]
MVKSHTTRNGKIHPIRFAHVSPILQLSFRIVAFALVSVTEKDKDRRQTHVQPENNQLGCATCLNPRVDIARSLTDYNSQPITKHVFLDSPSVAGDVGQDTDAAGHSSSNSR